MLNNRKWWLPVALFLVTLLVSCSPNQAGVELNKGFELSIGQSASLVGEDLKLTFDSVPEDSRCPRGVTCVWEGQASSILKVTAGGKEERLLLTEPGLTEGRQEIAYGLYKIEFHLIPYPEAGKTIDKKDYRLQLIITK